MRILLTAILVVLASPSWAFHSSALSPDIKQGVISLMERNPAQQEQYRQWGNALAGMQEACNYGNQQACQQLNDARTQLQSIGAITSGGPTGPAMPTYPPQQTPSMGPSVGMPQMPSQQFPQSPNMGPPGQGQVPPSLPGMGQQPPMQPQVPQMGDQNRFPSQNMPGQPPMGQQQFPPMQQR